MNTTQKELTAELMARMSEEDRRIAGSITGCLTALGYTPQRQKVRDFVLSFASSRVKQTIAKIGVRSGRDAGVFYSIKFYACKNPPEKYSKAVRAAALRSIAQYRCADCGICGAADGERGYRVAMPDGSEFLRCGAYVVEIPELTEEDADEFCRLVREQHTYFLSRNR
jgi:hypothetical protein